MKFTKVVILAGALAVPAFSQVVHSQDAATLEAPKDSRVAEWSKKVGMDCTVFESRDYTYTSLGGAKLPSEKPVKMTYKGTLYKVTDSTIEVRNLKRWMSAGKEQSAFITSSIPTKDVTRIKFKQLKKKK